MGTVAIKSQTNLFTDFLQLGHPAGGQVTVLQHHPRPVHQRLLYHLGCNGALHTATHLTSMKRDGEKGSLHVLGHTEITKAKLPAAGKVR